MSYSVTPPGSSFYSTPPSYLVCPVLGNMTLYVDPVVEIYFEEEDHEDTPYTSFTDHGSRTLQYDTYGAVLTASSTLSSSITLTASITDSGETYSATAEITTTEADDTTQESEEVSSSSTLPSVWESETEEPLIFSSVAGTAFTITFTGNGSPPTFAFSSSWDNSTWESHSLTATGTLYCPTGHVYLKGSLSASATSTANYWTITFDEQVTCQGPLTVLFGSTSIEGSLSVCSFYRLFYNSTNLVTGPDLPYELPGSYSYYQMFYGCSSLKRLSVLGATTLSGYTCYQMFYGCSSLIHTPEMTISSAAYRCCYQMFCGCTSLEEASPIRVPVLPTYSFTSLFSGCSSLSSVSFHTRDFSATSCLASWLDGVSDEGTLEVDSQGLIDDYPDGWERTAISSMRTESSPSSISISVGDCSFFTATVKDIDGTYKTVTYSSSDEDVCTVDSSSGFVYGLAAGTATLTASCSDYSSFSATCSVTVSEPSVSVVGIEITPSEIEVPSGGSATVMSIVYPRDAANSYVTWSIEENTAVEMETLTPRYYLSQTHTYRLSDSGAKLTGTVWLKGSTPLSLENMFCWCTTLQAVDLSLWKADFDQVSSTARMCAGCGSLTEVLIPSTLSSLSALTTADYMFAESGIVHFRIPQSISAGALVSAQGLFASCRDLLTCDLTLLSAPALSDMSWMFARATSLYALSSPADLFSIGSLNHIFYDCHSLKIFDSEGWITSSCTDFSHAFEGCSSLKAISLGSWDFSSALTIESLFNECSSLLYCDASTWTLSSCTNIRSVFNSCASLVTVDCSSWDVSGVTTMRSLFNGCSSLTSFGDLTGWDTGSCVNMDRMFRSCASLTSIDLSGWDVSKVTVFKRMFYGCSSLKTIDLSGWDMSACSYYYQIFYGCSSLTTITFGAATFNSSATSGATMFTGCSSLSTVNISGMDDTSKAYLVSVLEDSFTVTDKTTYLSLS